MGAQPRTAYSRNSLRLKREAAKRRTAKKRQKENKQVARAAGKCGARNRAGKFCNLNAGFGTTHPGIGCCKYHGGSLPSHKLNAYKQQAVFMGAEKDINPIDALMWCIRITAGEIEWYTEQMREIEKDDWFENTPLGKQMHVLARSRSDAISNLAKYSADAIKLGIEERRVRLAEQYGFTIAKLLTGIRSDLGLNSKQEKEWPKIVRKHLMLIESAPTDDDGQLALPRRAAA